MARSDDGVARGVRLTGFVLATVGAGWGLILLGKQVLHYLRFKEWLADGAVTYMGWAVGWPWAVAPDSWLGLHALLDWPNAGLTIALAALAIGLSLTNFEAE